MRTSNPISPTFGRKIVVYFAFVPIIAILLPAPLLWAQTTMPVRLEISSHVRSPGFEQRYSSVIPSDIRRKLAGRRDTTTNVSAVFRKCSNW
jgi:hypothetical protein